MTLSRRDFLTRSLAAGSAVALARALGVDVAYGAPGTVPRNVVFVELVGGNDGLNTIVPFGINGGAYYQHRKKLAVAESKVLKVGHPSLGFHPALAELRDFFVQGKLAVVQGVSYPGANFSHAFAQRNWHSGIPGSTTSSGWLGRWLALYPPASFPPAAEIGYQASLLGAGSPMEIPALGPPSAFSFPLDAKYPGDRTNRRRAHELMLLAAAAESGELPGIAATGDSVLSLIDTLKTLPPLTVTGAYPQHNIAAQLQIVLRLLAGNIGMRFFRVAYGNFDTHADQDAKGFHASLLAVLSQSLAAFRTDLEANGLAQDTLVVVFSEFGRTLAENDSGGTDHGTVNPVLILGDAVVGGFATAHPSLAPDKLTPSGEPAMTTDYRDVFATVLLRWLAESPAQVAKVFPGHALQDLGFLA
jgi:uncharacterized protein (DUF1501 family)